MSDLPRTPSTGNDAASLLDAAAKGDEAGSRLSRSAVGPLRAYALALAGLIGVFFLAIVYVLSYANPAVVWIGTGTYLVVLAVIVVGFLRARMATAPRANRRLLIGTVATTALFVIGTLLSTIVETRTPLLWIPCVVVMMLPLALSTFVRGSR